MKKIQSKKYLRIVLLMIVLFGLESCQRGVSHNVMESAVNTFFIVILHIINILILGTLSLVFTIIGQQKDNKALAILGYVFLSLFVLIFLMSLPTLLVTSIYNPFILLVLLAELTIIVVSVIYCVKPRNVAHTERKLDIETQLDDIINEEDEIV